MKKRILPILLITVAVAALISNSGGQARLSVRIAGLKNKVSSRPSSL